MKTQRRQHSQPYTPPTPLSIYCLRLPTSEHTKRVLLYSFRVCITFPALWIHEIPQRPYPLPYVPPTPISISSLRQPACKCTKRSCLNSFHIRITLPAVQIHQYSTAPTLSAIRPSYTCFHLFPVSTCLKIHETSSNELVSRSCNLPSPTDVRKLNSAHTRSYTPLLRPFSSIPRINLPPNSQNEFI